MSSVVSLIVIILLTLSGEFLYVRTAEICCPKVGCFNDDPPFNGMPLPDCPEGFNLTYTMYTRENRDEGQLFDDTTVPAAYVSSRRTVFMTHGWTSSGSSYLLTDMKNAFLDREDINAVILDWEVAAAEMNYYKSAMNTRSVGAQTALVFQNLGREEGSQYARMWCTGHSLGAHVCGHTGMRMPANNMLGRVTGMDPAGPAFEIRTDKTVGLNPTSALFVDILHTDVDLGTTRDIGHIDFYPAGGRDQPGCSLQQFTDETFQNWDVDGIPDQYNFCDHVRAFQFMIESIKRDCFATRLSCTEYTNLPGSCSECVCGGFPCSYMGYGADSSCQRAGIYYLDVTAAVPYCVG